MTNKEIEALTSGSIVEKLAEEEQLEEQLSYAERLAKVMESMKGRPLPTGVEPFSGDMPREMPDRFRKKREE